MRVNPTLWKKGVSGNPKGRPKKEATIGESLRTMMLESVEVPNRGDVVVRDLVMQYVQHGMLYGHFKTLTGKVFNLEFKDWLDTLKFITERIDGKALVIHHNTATSDEDEDKAGNVHIHMPSNMRERADEVLHELDNEI